MRVGVLSDTHNVIYPAVLERFKGVDHIIHTGDISTEHILKSLRGVAPVSAVTGNHDWGTTLARSYPRELTITLGGCVIYVMHIGATPELFYPGLPIEKPHVV